MKKLSTKEVTKSLSLMATEYKKTIPDNKKEGKAIFWGIKIMNQAKRYIRERDMAVKLLKDFAFVNIDDSIEDRKGLARDVQAFLRYIGQGDWLDSEIEFNTKNEE